MGSLLGNSEAPLIGDNQAWRTQLVWCRWESSLELELVILNLRDTTGFSMRMQLSFSEVLSETWLVFYTLFMSIIFRIQ